MWIHPALERYYASIERFHDELKFSDPIRELYRTRMVNKWAFNTWRWIANGNSEWAEERPVIINADLPLAFLLCSVYQAMMEIEPSILVELKLTESEELPEFA